MAKREEGAGILRALVEVVGLERLIHLLHMLNRHNENPLHFAAGYGHQGCVFLDVVIKNYLPQLIDLLEIKNNIGNTPLHVAAQLRNDEFIIAAGRAVDAVVGENQFIQFVSLTNNAGQTLAQIFVESQERVALATGRIP
jgi:ankyrin repeat protein